MSPIDDEELDRLADYAAGLLDRETAARVRERIATDPDWAGAYADLAGADPRLDAALADLRDPPLPRDVADRLSAALAGERGPAGTRTTNVVDLAARRRWTHAATVLTAAAAVLVVVLGGAVALSVLRPSVGSNTAGSAARAPENTDALASTPGFAVEHTGTNYSAQTLPGVGQPAAPAAPGPTRSVLGGQGARSDSEAAPPAPDVIGLQRLYDGAALQQCLDAIRTRYSGEPRLVDYARWQGVPALIVVLTVGDLRRIVVVGPSCGLPGTGTDERYSTLG